MDDDGLDYRHMHYYDPHVKNNLGLHLSSAAGEHRTKPFLSNGGFLYRDCGVSHSAMPPSAMQMDFMRDVRNGWMGQRDGSIAGIGLRDGNIGGIAHRDPTMMMDHRYDLSGMSHRESNIASLLSSNHNYSSVLSSAADSHTLQMLQPPDPPKDDTAVPEMEDIAADDIPLMKKKKRKSQSKPPKPKKPKKTLEVKDGGIDPSVSRRKGEKKNMGLVINGFSIDLSGIPPPVCSCTGTPQQCYRWGAGGWQSACCTTSMSVYPLPMSCKRKGARIAGRKMSLGAFKKVLEKLAGDGHRFKDPIDLKLFWAKHGTNKFVTIR
ncbi:Protein Barley B recombinant [Platanthera guangdongensis]|uniref:GAGA-binding transcriptional activator n=1 Tax=Platanthera guangdongensis TaxID=2320717 RepID=A0ABR2LQL4_9ASPA